MSRDDHISKLFRDAADTAEHKPRLDLWDRLERRLDEDMPLDQETSPTQPNTNNVVSMSAPRRWNRWMVAAASISAIVLGSWAFFQSNNWIGNDTADKGQFQNVPTDIEILESDLPIAALTEEEKEQEFIAEDKKQLQQLAKEVNEAKGSNKKVSIDEMKIKEIKAAIEVEDSYTGDLLEMDDIVEISTEPLIEPTPEPSSPNAGNNSVENIAEKDNDVNADLNMNARAGGLGAMANNTTYMYSNGQASNSNSFNYAEPPSVQNRAFAEDEALAKSVEKEKLNLKSNRNTTVGTISGTTSRRKIQMRAKGNESIGKTKKKARNRSGLQMFDWILGEWNDKSQITGTSYEAWTMKTETVLQGEGIVMKGNSKIFQEKMELVFKNNQIFLVLELDDTRQKIDYMMYGYEMDEKTGGYVYTFDQSHNPKYPNRIVFRRSPDSNEYSLIIVDNDSRKNILGSDIQQYLDNRNHVSGARSRRTLSRSGK